MNILIMGKPGSGKGTITQNLTDEGFLQLSTGDLLREEEENINSPFYQEITEKLKEGKFASDPTIFKIVNKFLDTNHDKSIIFDGYPRNVAQAQVCMNNQLKFDYVFLIEVSDDVIKQRIVNRRVHPSSGRVYNLLTMPPKVEGIDDITGEPLVHRKDDRLEVLDKRLENFNTLTAPIIDFLPKHGYNIIKIDGEAPLEEQIKLVKNTIGLVPHKKLKM